MEVAYISVQLRVSNEPFHLQFFAPLLKHFLILVFKIFSESARRTISLHGVKKQPHSFIAASQFLCCKKPCKLPLPPSRGINDFMRLQHLVKLRGRGVIHGSAAAVFPLQCKYDVLSCWVFQQMPQVLVQHAGWHGITGI